MVARKKPHRCVVRRKQHSLKRKQSKIKRYTAWWRYLVFFVLIFIYIVTVGYVLFGSSVSRIDVVQNTGVERLSEYDIHNVVTSEIDGFYFQYFPQAQYIFVNAGKIEEKVKNFSGIVQDVSVRKVFPNKLIVDIKEWNRVVVWCSLMDDMTRECFLFDDDGIIGERVYADDLIMKQNIVIEVMDKTKKPLFSGMEISMISINKIDDIFSMFESVDVDIAYNSFSLSHRESHNIMINTDEGWYVIFSLDHDITKIEGLLRSLLKYEIIGERREYLEYIDMRIENKAFYYMRNDYDDADDSDSSLDDEGKTS